MAAPQFDPVENLWDDKNAASMGPQERLIYRSNLLGADVRITNTGGGNTSSKIQERDPLTREKVEVLWVKGSGGDLRTARRENFASLVQDRLLALQEVYLQKEDRGPKTAAEDAMVALYSHCTFNLNPRACSIDTPLHSFIPYRCVDHTHPVACIAIATAADGEALTREIYGEEVRWVDWRRPGFELGLQMQDVCRAYPQTRGVILGGHGLINWADDDLECYLLSLRLINKAARVVAEGDLGVAAFGGPRVKRLPEDEPRKRLAALLPWLRGRLSRERRVIATAHADPDTMAFVNSRDAQRLAELGTSCPDHFIRTKIKPLYVKYDPHKDDLGQLQKTIDQGLEGYRRDYVAYYAQHRRPDSPPMRVSNPSVVLLPGLGMVAWGKNKSESRVTAEFYGAAIGVIRGAEGLSRYTAIDKQEAFDIEYWLLEEAKIRRRPAERELARQIVAVFGGGSGIGKEAARRLIREGAAVAVLDINAAAAEAAAQEILSEIGMGIGVAGTGASRCGDVIGLGVDITQRASVREALAHVTLAFGGVDTVVVTAGYYAALSGPEADASWGQTFNVNVRGAYLVADEAKRIWNAQRLSGSLVLTSSVNATVPKAGSFAYDVSKAAANHLVRELAIDLAPHVRVNGIAPATVVEGSAMFPRDRVLASLSKYDLAFDPQESTVLLRERLAAFYAGRALLKQPITITDPAEAIFLLASGRLAKTTGQILTVDGGLPAAFLR